MGFKLTIEIPMMMVIFSAMLSDSINTNLMIYRTCYVLLGYDKYNCSLLGNTQNNITKELETLVQPRADVITMVKSFVDSVSSTILCLFVGAWSDRFGRKPLIISNLLGGFLMNVVMIVFAAVESLSPWYMLMCSIPVILSGGGAAMMTVLLSYLTDVTAEDERGFRMGIFETVLAVSVLAGTLSSSYVFNAIGYVGVYGISAGMSLLALVYAVLFIPESLQERETTNRVKGIFQLQNMSDMFKTSFKPRPHHNRAIILLILLVMGLTFTVFTGDAGVMFYFCGKKFNWVLKQYTQFSATCNVIWMLSTMIIVYLLNYKLKVDESKLVFVGCISIMGAALIQALAQYDWLMYLAAVVRMPSCGNSPLARSLVSKLVNDNEMGKIFGLFTLTQNILGLIGNPLYTNLYNATITTYPGMFNFLTFGAHAITTCAMGTVLVLQRSEYRTLQEEQEVEREHTRED